MVESARLEIVYVLKGASRVRIPLSPYYALCGYVWQAKIKIGQGKLKLRRIRQIRKEAAGV